MKQKKLMLLGGLRYLLPVIEEAHKMEKGISDYMVKMAEELAV